ncbi:hypothetical protein M432DRAFT_395814 [Thermoascus aurantiacus ATCC 26904]
MLGGTIHRVYVLLVVVLFSFSLPPPPPFINRNIFISNAIIRGYVKRIARGNLIKSPFREEAESVWTVWNIVGRARRNVFRVVKKVLTYAHREKKTRK